MYQNYTKVFIFNTNEGSLERSQPMAPRHVQIFRALCFSHEITLTKPLEHDITGRLRLPQGCWGYNVAWQVR